MHDVDSIVQVHEAATWRLLLLQAGWVCQALAAMGVPYAPNILYTPNGMGKVFFWIFVMFPWNPLTKGVLDMSAAASNSLHPGKQAWTSPPPDCWAGMAGQLNLPCRWQLLHLLGSCNAKQD